MQSNFCHVNCGQNRMPNIRLTVNSYVISCYLIDTISLLILLSDIFPFSVKAALKFGA